MTIKDMHEPGILNIYRTWAEWAFQDGNTFGPDRAGQINYKKKKNTWTGPGFIRTFLIEKYLELFRKNEHFKHNLYYITSR